MNPGSRSRSRKAAAAAVATALATLVLGLQPGAPSASAQASKPQHDRTAERAIAALQRHPQLARQVAGQAFKVTGTTLRDADGSTHVRLERTYRGLPVIGGDLVVHQAAGADWKGVSQTLRAPITVSVRPKVSESRADRAVTAKDRTTRQIRKLRVEDGRLVVDTLAGKPRLAWEITSGGRYKDGTPSRLLTYVDARTGNVIRREERIQTVDGDGSSLYSGVVPLQVTKSGLTYQLKDPTRGNTYTTDFGNKTDGLLCQLFGSGCKPGTTFTSPDTSFGNGTTSNRESAGVDAQYGTNVTWDYYQQVHGRNGIFGTGAGSFNRVHYGNAYVNAFWDGTKMTYGDGDGVSYGPLVSLDVAGHEMSHGVTENSAGLTYSGESGGLNESTSDIFGTMVEFFAANANDSGDYFIGEEFDLANHSGFRRMDNPALDGNSDSCWTTGTKNKDVHYSSGVGNHFFYLLAEGSGQKTIGNKVHNSPTCNGSTITGIGRTDAQRIWYRALTVYMTSGTTYAQARTATLSAAADLFGNGSNQYNTVAAAWSAVNVN
ncbi:M4 family metallopeptidase [Nocardioides humilatus]|uniref:Neutral metalloproteinase n=1 Tax=Nocardioides humilatus TaxID=2607660 RepID=A0A5B1LCN0_9ACTN|nr:M4 family metallopeptidase [Nocardioides humilatus]